MGFYHFIICSHLDHCGGLPYFTEMCGYKGPILMTVTIDFEIALIN
jgi:Cft2 family RNA processing exonuclease